MNRVEWWVVMIFAGESADHILGHHGSVFRRSVCRTRLIPKTAFEEIGGRRLEGSTVGDLGRGLDVPPAFECFHARIFASIFLRSLAWPAPGIGTILLRQYCRVGMVMARCLIGCGSNLGRRREHLDRAIELMRFMPGVTLVGVSRYRETVPVGGPPGQDAFLNGACLVETDLPPQDVLSMLTAVENTLHRTREERWGPRTVDLDLLLYDNLILETDCLTLPHPRMSTRRFVLEPCVEIAGDALHPLAACTLDEMLASISSPRPHVAVVGVPATAAADIARAVSESSLGCLVTAPRPLPQATAPTQSWCSTLGEWCAALEEVDCDEGAQGIVTDFWLETLLVAARDTLDAGALVGFEGHFAKLAAEATAPQAVLLLVAPPARLAGDPWQTRLQEKLIAAIRDPEYRSPLKAKAVVMIDTTDASRAAADAVAAVEAMV